MAWQSSQQASTQTLNQRGEVLLLLSGSLFAPFTLLICLTLYKLAGCRSPANKEAEAEVKCRRRSALRQVALVVWLAAASAFAAAGVNYAAMRDFSLEAAPGDQRVMVLGSWAGICETLAVTAGEPTSARLFNPGLSRARWRTERFTRRLAGQLGRPGSPGVSGARGDRLTATWEVPALSRERPARLTLAANFRHQVRLGLLRRPGEQVEADGGEGTRDGGRGFGGELQLVNDVQGINSVTHYNVTLSGQLTMRLTNPDQRAAAAGANFTYTANLTAWRFATHGSDSDADPLRIDCRLGQEPCTVDNPAPRLILHLLPADPAPQAPVASTTPGRQRLTVRCERQVALVRTAPVILPALACLPCTLVLLANALLAFRVPFPSSLCTAWWCRRSQVASGTRRSSLARNAQDRGGRGAAGGGKQLGVRFQLQEDTRY